MQYYTHVKYYRFQALIISHLTSIMDPYPRGLERGSSTKWLTSCWVSGRGIPPLARALLPLPPGCPSATSMAAAYWLRRRLALMFRTWSLKLKEDEGEKL